MSRFDNRTIRLYNARDIRGRGKMITAAVYTCVLLSVLLLAFVTSAGKLLPMIARLVPLVSIALAWAHAYVFLFDGEGGIPGIVLLVLFYVLTFGISIPIGTGLIVFVFIDRERVLQPEVIGDPSRSNRVCVVYHPGASDFTVNCIRACALKLAEKGFSTTIASAHDSLAVVFKNYKAILFGSPVYGGMIRPPVVNFIKRTNLSGIACFILLTGGNGETSVIDIQKAAELITKSRGSVTGAIKVTQKDDEVELRKSLEAFGSQIAEVA